MLGAPVAGSRTCRWTIAAPAPAASIAAVAICAGVTGRLGCWSGRVMLPVTAQVMMIFAAMVDPRSHAGPDTPPAAAAFCQGTDLTGTRSSREVAVRAPRADGTGRHQPAPRTARLVS